MIALALLIIPNRIYWFAKKLVDIALQQKNRPDSM